jgi:hypothetical protein
MLNSEEQMNKGNLWRDTWILANMTNSPRKVSDLLIAYETAVTVIILRYGSEYFS